MAAINNLGKNIRVLVVEDDRLTRKILESFFDAFDMIVEMAEDGLQGLEKFEQGEFDIIISDYNMPKMNGLEMLRRIREASPSAKIVLMTIYTESSVLIEAINLGVNRFIEKPLYKDNLKKVIEILASEVQLGKELERHQNLLKAYRLGVDASTIFSLLDAEGNYTYVNNNFCFISDYSESELIGENYSLIRKETGVSDLHQMTMEGAGDSNVWQGCIVNIAKGGHEYVTEASLMPVYEKGKVTSYISIEKDMSFVISQHSIQLQRFFDADRSIMFAFGKDMSLKICNSSFLEFFGYKDTKDANEQNFCFKNYITFVEGEVDGEAVEADCWSFKEILKVTKDVSISKMSLKKSKDSKEHFYMPNIFQLDQSYLALDDLVVVRLNDITELENLRREEMNSAMLASIGKLSAGITHEINTPLTYIKGNMELLEWEMSDSVEQGTFEDMKEYFTSINDGISRISTIIESMKEVTGEATFELQETNLFTTFIVACRMVYNRSKHISPIYINDIPFNMELRDDRQLFSAKVSAKMLEQVWIILLNNSLDQLAQSDLTFERKYIKIDIEKTDDKHRITIRDNGGGISDKVLNKIFDLFASTKKHKGMGIGLNIAKNIIGKHNGTISPYNDEHGAVFEIIL
ncbi:MAG: response regulator [Deferribacterales bacterium]